jgi:hypothetical protein
MSIREDNAAAPVGLPTLPRDPEVSNDTVMSEKTLM